SSRRLFQESWPINFESFPASTYTHSKQKKAGSQPRHFSRIKCCPANAESTRSVITACPKRETSPRRATGFGRASSKRRYALWNSGPWPERYGDKSLFAGGRLH